MLEKKIYLDNMLIYFNYKELYNPIILKERENYQMNFMKNLRVYFISAL